jgi:hypothetical protein
MFQVYFLKNIGRPEGLTQQQILQEYNKSYGRPNNKMKEQLHKTCKEVLEVAYWPYVLLFCHSLNIQGIF